MTLDWGITYSIPLDVAGFDPSWPNLNSAKAIEVTAEELVWSAMMVGYPGQVLDFWALLHRASIVLAYLSAPVPRPMMASPLKQSRDFEQADLTEKGAISYYLGMFAAKTVAARLLDIPWLVHYDFLLRAVGGKVSGPRPDLIGLSHRGPAPGCWFAVEAKGRNHDLKDAGLEGEFAKAKFQLAQTALPLPRATGVASIATFRSKEWRVAWRDPEPPPGIPFDEDDHARFLANYYEPVLHFVREMTRLRDGSPIRLSGATPDRPGAEPAAEVAYSSVDVPQSPLYIAIPTAAVEASTGQAMVSDAAVSAFLSSCGTLVRGEPATTDPEVDETPDDRGDAQPRASRSDLAAQTGRSDAEREPQASPWVAAAPTAVDENGRRWTVGTDGVAIRLG